MDLDKANYISRYYSRLFTAQERFAKRHLIATLKLTHGRDDPAAQAEATRKYRGRQELFSDDPEVLLLASQGYKEFILTAAERIMQANPDSIFFNRCPRCGKLARTPKAKQCRFCSRDWHNEPQQNQNSTK